MDARGSQTVASEVYSKHKSISKPLIFVFVVKGEIPPFFHINWFPNISLYTVANITLAYFPNFVADNRSTFGAAFQFQKSHLLLSYNAIFIRISHFIHSINTFCWQTLVLISLSRYLHQMKTVRVH